MARAVEIDVNLGTVRNVEAVLRDASVPISRYRILKTLAAEGHATTQPRLEIALQYLFEHELAVEGEKGVQWTQSGSDSLRRAVAVGRRV